MTLTLFHGYLLNVMLQARSWPMHLACFDSFMFKNTLLSGCGNYTICEMRKLRQSSDLFLIGLVPAFQHVSSDSRDEMSYTFLGKRPTFTSTNPTFPESMVYP